MRYAYLSLLIVMMFASLLVIPVPGVAQTVGGVYVKASVDNYTKLGFVPGTILITNTGNLWVIINRTYLTWLGDTIRLSLILSNDTVDPNVGGFFFNVSNIGEYAPSNPSKSPYGGVINITKEGPLYAIINGVTTIVGYVKPVKYNNSGIISDLSVIKIDMKYFNLSSVTYIRNVYLEESVSGVNLYNQKLVVKVFKATSWDASTSSNSLKIVYIPVSCSDVVINVTTNQPNGILAHGWSLIVNVSFEKFFKKVEDITGIKLNISSDNETLIKLINEYAPSEEYILANYTNGVLSYNVTPMIVPGSESISTNGSAVFFSGVIDDFAPAAPNPNPDGMSLHSTYYVDAYFFHAIVNETTNLTFTIHCNSWNAASSINSKFADLYATWDVYIDPTVFGDPTCPNPHDILYFRTHNVPRTYNVTGPEFIDYIGIIVSNPYYGTYTVKVNLSQFLTVSPNYNGVINGSIEIPDGPYGVPYVWIELVMTDGQYLIPYETSICPYFATYIVTNTSMKAIDGGTYYDGVFVEKNYGAPGDYLLIEGYGYQAFNDTIMQEYFKALMNGTELVRLYLTYNNYTGRVLAVFKILTTGFTYPLNTGTYNLTVGVLGSGWAFVNDKYSKSFTVVRNTTVEKVLFNPRLVFNGTSFVLRHDKIGKPYINVVVDYPLVNDTFTTISWPFNTTIEVIGWSTDNFVLKLYNENFSLLFPWINISLTNGYGLKNLYGTTIPFLPYGDYTFLEGTLPTVENRTILTVHMGVDVDVDTCRNGTISVSVVGAAPNTEYNFTFSYQAHELHYGITRYISPQWTGSFNVTVITDKYGTGSTTLPLTSVYPTSYVTNLTWDVITWLRLNGTGSLFLEVNVNLTFQSFTDNLTTPILYVLGPSDIIGPYWFEYYVNASYNVTVQRVTVGYLPRSNVVISVPEVVLPGDTITVQIFPHNGSVWGTIVEPTLLFNENQLIGWYLDVRLVDPLNNHMIEEVAGYHAGKLIVEDVDGDGVNEVWFVVNLTAPFILGEDKTYRVDTEVFLAVLNPTSNVSGVRAVDNGCMVNVDLNGTIYWNGYGSGIMLGGDGQIVTVLGVLEGKLDTIKNGIAVINATVNDISSFLKVNVTELLKEINGSVAIVKNDTATLLVGQAKLEMKLDDLLNLTKEINESVAMIISCCGDMKNMLERIGAKVNATYDLVLTVKDNVTDLINIVNNVVIPKFGELYRNVSLEINASRDMILEEISSVNESIITALEAKTEYLESLIENLNTTLLNKLDEVEGELILYMTAYEQRLEGVINETADDIVYRLSVQIDNTYQSLKGLINLRADELEMFINDNVTTLLAKIKNVNMTIHDKLNLLLMKIEESNATIMAGLVNLETNLNNTAKLILENINITNIRILNLTQITASGFLSTAIAIGNATASIEKYVNESISTSTSKLEGLALKINNSLTLLIIGKVKDLNNFLTNMQNTMTNKIIGDLSRDISALGSNLSTKLNNMNKTLAGKIDSSLKTLENDLNSLSSKLDTTKTDIVNSLSKKVDDATQTLSNKLDSLRKAQESSMNTINGNISLFGAASLLLLVITIGLVGYGLIARRPVG